MTPVNFTVGKRYTNLVILKVSRYFTVTGAYLGICLIGYGVYTTGQSLLAIGFASVLQAIRIG